MGKSKHSAELSLTKTLNRLIRSTLRTIGSSAQLPKLRTGPLLDNLQTIVVFCRQVQRSIKDLTKTLRSISPDPFNSGAESRSASTQVLNCTQLLVPQVTFEYLHVGAESTHLAKGEQSVQPREDDFRLVLTSLHNK